MELHEKLKNARQNVGYSQETVAQKLNLSRQAISRWETGKACPDIHVLAVLSKLYGISLDDLTSDLPDTTATQPESAIPTLSHDTEVVTEIQKMKSDFHKLLIIAAAVLSCLIPVLGLIVSTGILIYCIHKKESFNRLLWSVMFICIIINIFNSFTMLNEWYFHIGKASVEIVSL